MKEFYLNNDLIDASGPRAQTGPRSSFMGKMMQMRDEEKMKHHNVKKEIDNDNGSMGREISTTDD